MSEHVAPRLLERYSDRNAFARDVLDGLSQPQRRIPSRWLYDAEGSRLFEEITELWEYYPTRTEIAILGAHARELMASAPQGTVLVEFGSGSSRKTELLLSAGAHLSAYMPIDVSPSALQEAQERLAQRFPDLPIQAVAADFSELDHLPTVEGSTSRLGFFPGSTIGNLDHREAVGLLRSIRRLLGHGGRLVIGTDLKKSEAMLLRAYDDAKGVTARFNLNLLHRINRELGANIETRVFRHAVRYDAVQGRIEMHLLATRSHAVQILGHDFSFDEGETIHTENSYKFSIPQFHFLARQSGWAPRRVFTDPARLFCVHELA